MTELEVINENWDRFRTVTVQFLDVLNDGDLQWRPTPEAFSCGQQLLHIAQTEDFYYHGFTAGEWDAARLKFPKHMPGNAELRRHFGEVRERMKAYLGSLTAADLDRELSVPHAPPGLPLRWWLWFILEHEIHHKAQLAVYLRQMGRVAPYFAFPFPPGERPDFAVRAELGGV